MAATTALRLTALEARDVPSAVVPAAGTSLGSLPRGRYAVASGEGNAAQVNVYDSATGAMTGILTPFGRAFTGGVRVATGDLTGDGVEDVVVAQSTGGGTVKVFDGKTLAEVRSFEPFAGSKAGTSVAVGDVTGDGRADLVAAVAGGGSAVKVFDGKTLCPAGPITTTALPTAFRSFNAFEAGFTGGATVAAGDVDGDGKAEVIAGAGPGTPPMVRVFSGRTGMTMHAFYANAVTFRGGVSVAAADLDGDGKAEILTGSGAGGGPEVQVYKNFRLVAAFRAFEVSDRRGIRIAAQDVDGDGKAEIIVASAAGGAPRVKVLATDAPVSGRTIREFPAFLPSFTGGVYVG